MPEDDADLEFMLSVCVDLIRADVEAVSEEEVDNDIFETCAAKIGLFRMVNDELADTLSSTPEQKLIDASMYTCVRVIAFYQCKVYEELMREWDDSDNSALLFAMLTMNTSLACMTELQDFVAAVESAWDTAQLQVEHLVKMLEEVDSGFYYLLKLALRKLTDLYFEDEECREDLAHLVEDNGSMLSVVQVLGETLELDLAPCVSAAYHFKLVEAFVLTLTERYIGSLGRVIKADGKSPEALARVVNGDSVIMEEWVEGIERMQVTTKQKARLGRPMRALHKTLAARGGAISELSPLVKDLVEAIPHITPSQLDNILGKRSTSEMASLKALIPTRSRDVLPPSISAWVGGNQGKMAGVGRVSQHYIVHRTTVRVAGMHVERLRCECKETRSPEGNHALHSYRVLSSRLFDLGVVSPPHQSLENTPPVATPKPHSKSARHWFGAPKADTSSTDGSASDSESKVHLNLLNRLRRGHKDGDDSHRPEMTKSHSGVSVQSNGAEHADWGTCYITVVEARDLLGMDRNGSSDPFITLSTGGRRDFKTKVQHKTLNPEWGECFNYPASVSLVQLNCIDHKKIVHDVPLGQVTINVSAYPMEEEVDVWLELEADGDADVSGAVHVKIFKTVDG